MGASEFAERLRLLREASGKSQRRLARDAGLSNGTISQAESGDLWVGQLPSHDVMRRLADALGVPLAVLAGEEPPDAADIERDQVFALMMAHKQAGPMLIRLKAEAPVDEYDDLLDEALEHFAISLGRRLRRRREEMGGG